MVPNSDRNNALIGMLCPVVVRQRVKQVFSRRGSFVFEILRGIFAMNNCIEGATPYKSLVCLAVIDTICLANTLVFWSSFVMFAFAS